MMLRYFTVRYLIILLCLVAIGTLPFWGGVFYTGIGTRVAIFATAAASLNLLLGFGGMVSFGHAAFLGIGAYAVGIPAYHGYDSGWLHLFIAVAGSAIYGLATGALVLRVRGVHFIMLTLAVAQILFFVAMSLEIYGGGDGMLIDTRSHFFPLGSLESDTTLYYTALFILFVSFFLIHRIVNSHFGLIIQGVRMNEERMESLGYNTYPY
ncbi:MAG: branched-chain amino acid ABC transporter permease, partial [Alphaproteobacteria bacterium]|nr:branched-chain amino acid ABC transporter permease [Alphaproteobacteria bacterium]